MSVERAACELRLAFSIALRVLNGNAGWTLFHLLGFPTRRSWYYKIVQASARTKERSAFFKQTSSCRVCVVSVFRSGVLNPIVGHETGRGASSAAARASDFRLDVRPMNLVPLIRPRRQGACVWHTPQWRLKLLFACSDAGLTAVDSTAVLEPDVAYVARATDGHVNRAYTKRLLTQRS